MMVEPVWARYATYDDDGYVSGIRDDAPQEAKEAFEKYQEEQREYQERGEFIPR